jgi:hypothetical protein
LAYEILLDHSPERRTTGKRLAAGRLFLMLIGAEKKSVIDGTDP